MDKLDEWINSQFNNKYCKKIKVTALINYTYSILILILILPIDYNYDKKFWVLQG